MITDPLPWATALLLGWLGLGTFVAPRPYRLGPYHNERVTLLRSMFEVLGQPRNARVDVFCYSNAGESAYVWMERDHDSPDVGDIMLTAYPNCLHEPVRPTAAPLRHWTTERGIGLGSTQADVERAYGPPDERGTALSEGSDVVHGAAWRTTPAPGELIDVQWLYNTPSLRGAKFGLRAGRVVWIFLTQTD